MGQASINHAPFATNQFGLKVDLGFETGILTVAQFRGESWTRHSDTVERQPFYTEGLIQGFQRAGEQASRR